ncbi:RING finger protein 10 isoform X1 [Electrophorus electricus]|uniref:RING finger protein 10 isoform X1 n=1 Tax=Electrophorus electricus TaxID=8005 RepID=UPI0015CFD36D|nr:RING finger protein 10 isoform X1 [Electrophorus electricus]
MLESSDALSAELGPSPSAHRSRTSMEKNPPRSGSAGPAPGESKTKTDAKSNGGSKRYNRKREPSFPKAEGFPGPRRTHPQKGKSFDKRPPQRGVGGGRQGGLMGGGRREEVVETRRAEFSPAQFSGPKKISLNHLLNFTFEPRGGHFGSGGDGHSCWGRRNKWGHKHKPFNKELFLQANCQFVVINDQNYQAHFTDPDTLVSWDCVQQVRIYSHEVPSCPICLYPPVAAHITRCGHIYCWSCMLHYLSLSEKTWSKCPICYEAVHDVDLKSVVAMETRQYVSGDLITMRLMRREKGVLVALPSSQWIKVEEPIRFGDVRLSAYSKLLLASQEQVLGLLAEERAALQLQLRQEQDGPQACFIQGALLQLQVHTLRQEQDDPQACFIQGALLQLQEREQSLLNRSSPDGGAVEGTDMERLSLADCTSAEVAVNNLSSSKPVLQYVSAFDDEVQQLPDKLPEKGAPGAAEVAEQVSERPGEESPPPELCETGPSQTSQHGPFYYFYQAEDGQQMFLHPVNVRCLLRQYGSLENSPESITAAVVEIEGHTVNEDVRRRHRYLSHLPLTCEFSICELDLQPPVLSKETLDSFSDDLEKRKRLRQKKVRDEKRRERRIEMEENRKQGKYPEVHIGLENLQQFPAFGSPPQHSPPAQSPEFLPVLSCSPASDGLMFPSLSGQSPCVSVVNVEEDSHCVSFAQMLKGGKARVDSEPKPAPKKNAFLAPPVADSDGESDGSDRVPVPNFQNSFSQAFEAALLRLDHTPSAPAEALPTSEDKGGKKKKKKQKLLFSTSMVHTK